MPRYAGPSRELKHKLLIRLDDDGLAHLNACADKENVALAESVRRAIELRYITICLSKSIDRTIQSDTQEQQP